MLRTHYLQESLEACAARLPARTHYQVALKARSLGLLRQQKGPNRPSTPEIDEMIRAHYALPVRERRRRTATLLLRVDRTRQWVYVRALNLGLTLPRGSGRGPIWTEAEDAILRQSPDAPFETLSRRLRNKLDSRRGPAAVAARVEKLGLRRAAREERDWITAQEAGELLGCADASVRRWIRRGLLHAEQMVHLEGSPWRIERGHLRAFLLRNPTLWDVRSCAHLWVVELLAGPLGDLSR